MNFTKNFLDALDFVLKKEGGYVNHPADRGGPTNYGITQKTYEQWLGRKVTADDIRLMPLSHAQQIYFERYWKPVGGDAIKNFGIALALFDQAVNRGVSTVIKQAQAILGVTQDGVMGNQTLAKLNAANPNDFLMAFIQRAEQSYRAIVERNPSQAVFLKGWLNRINSLASTASQFVSQNKVSIALLLATALLAYYYMSNKKQWTSLA